MAPQIDEKPGVNVVGKDDVSLTITSVKDSLLDHNTRLVETERVPKLAWQPGFKARFPWMSLACLGVVIWCSVGAVLVLWRSNNQSATIWHKHVQPNVILAILGSVSNIFITAAVGQAVAMAWWRRALKGTTVQDLHHSWSFSTSLTAIFMEYKHFNALALAALMTKFALIDGVLLQQSLGARTQLGSQHNQTFYSNAIYDFPQTAALSANDSTTVQNVFGLFDILLYWRWSSNEIYDPWGFQQCRGICEANITTIGFTANCDTVTEHVDIRAESMIDGQNKTRWTMFGIDFQTIPSTASRNYSYIQAEVTTYTKQNRTKNDGPQSCPGTLQKRTCELRPALITYPVAMQTVDASVATDSTPAGQTKVVLGRADEYGPYLPNMTDWSDNTTQLDGFELKSTLDFQDTGGDGDPRHSRLAGITQVMKESFASHGYLHSTTNGHLEMGSQGQYASVAYGASYDPTMYSDHCPLSWSDPMGDIVFGLNTLMFLLSDKADVQNTAIVGTEMRNEVYYTWKWGYTVGAVVCTIFCILCILPAYWGFWELGREVSLSPFEIANAFEAPVLASVHPGSGHVDAVLEAAGQQYVRYVARDDHVAGGCLRFEAQGRT